MLNDHPTSQQEQLAANIAHVRSAIARAASKVGRNPDEILLVAVSKTQPVARIKAAYDLGLRDFGENKVQEALAKIAELHPPDLHWHMIGHLQSNKANKIVGSFASVQSVDSLHLAQILNRHVASSQQRLPVLLEVNIAGEESKAGMTEEETISQARQIAALPYLDVQGLMTIAPLVEDAEQVRPIFSQLRALRDRLREAVPESSWQHLSMGMTDDYSVAIEEGATIVRIGRAIFGERTYP